MKTIRIGRSATNDCVFTNSTVSGTHAVLTVDSSGERGTLRDLNSTNGTFVNNKRVTVETLVTANDSIKLGSEITTIREIVAKSERTKVKQSLPGIDRRTIGKNTNCDIRLTQDDVSREHAIIYKTETGSIVIEDRGSTNGTYVNGIKITSKELHPGDKVTITRNYPLDWKSIYKPPLPPKPTFKWQRLVAILAGCIVLAAMAIWGIGHIPDKELKPEEIYAMYKKSVVLIYNQYTFQVTVGGDDIGNYVKGLSEYNHCYLNGNGEIEPGMGGTMGTGFLYSSDGRIATNRHVALPYLGYETAVADYIENLIKQALVNNYAEYLIRRYGSKAQAIVSNVSVSFVQSISIAMNDAHLSSEKDLLPCTLLKVSDDNNLDVAVIQLNTKETPSSVTTLVDMDNLADDEHLSMGKSLYTIGFPKGLEWALTQQGVQATNESGSVNQSVNEYLYGHNINVTHGASGSPVFDTKGRFAGMIVSGAEFQSVSPSGEIQRIPAQHNQAIKPLPVANFIKNVY